MVSALSRVCFGLWRSVSPKLVVGFPCFLGILVHNVLFFRNLSRLPCLSIPISLGCPLGTSLSLDTVCRISWTPSWVESGSYLDLWDPSPLFVVPWVVECTWMLSKVSSYIFFLVVFPTCDCRVVRLFRSWSLTCLLSRPWQARL